MDACSFPELIGECGCGSPKLSTGDLGEAELLGQPLNLLLNPRELAASLFTL